MALQSATMIEAQVKAGHAQLFRTGIVLTLRAETIATLAELSDLADVPDHPRRQHPGKPR
jgi:hypothetical protein